MAQSSLNVFANQSFIGNKIFFIFIIFIFANANVFVNAENKLALNISKLLDKLLTNYSKSLRPNYGTG